MPNARTPSERASGGPLRGPCTNGYLIGVYALHQGVMNDIISMQDSCQDRLPEGFRRPLSFRIAASHGPDTVPKRPGTARCIPVKPGRAGERCMHCKVASSQEGEHPLCTM